MDLSIVSSLLSTVHSPTSSNDARQAAQKRLEELKEQCNMQIALTMVHKDSKQPEFVRHFGLHIADYIIRLKWNNLSQPQKDEIKMLIIQLILNGLGGTEEVLFVKEKSSQILTEIAKREWPQRWPNFLDFLSELLSKEGLQSEISLITLRSMAEDIFIFIEEMDEERRNDLLNAMTAVSDQIVSKIINYMKLQMSKNPLTQENLRLCATSLNTLSSYVDWIPIKIIEDFNIIPSLCSLLDVDYLRKPTSECLFVLSSRKLKSDETSHTLIIYDYLDLILKSIQNPHSNYDFHKQICQTLVNFSINNLFTGNTLPPNCAKFLDVMTTFSLTESHLISSFLVPFWSSCFKTKMITESAFFDTIAQKVIIFARKKLMKVGDPELDNHPSCQYSKEDFESTSEFRKFFGILRNKLMELVKVITETKPYLVASYLHQSIPRLLGDKEIENVVKCTVFHPFYIELEAEICFLECSIPVFSKIPEMKASTNQLLEMFLRYNTKHPLLISKKLTGLHSFIYFFLIDQTLLQPVLEMVFSFVTYKQPNEDAVVSSNWSISEDSLSVRRKACSCMVKMGMEIPELLLPKLQDLFTAIQKLVQDNLLTTGEKSFLIELLILIGNTLEENAQNNFFASIINPILNDSLNELPKDLESFLKQTGVSFLIELVNRKVTTLDDSSKLLLKNFTYSRRKMFYNLSTIFLILKRVNHHFEVKCRKNKINPSEAPHPYNNFILNTAYLLFPAIKEVHSLWKYLSNPSLSPEIRTLKEMSEVERAFIIGEENPSFEEPYEQATYSVNTEIKKIKTFLSHFRSTCYHLASQMCSVPNFFKIPSVSNLILQSFFEDAEFIEIRHIKGITSLFIRNLVLKCPGESLNVLLPILPPFLQFTCIKINQSWSGLNLSQDKMEENENETESEEIIQEKVTRDMTRMFSDLMVSIFCPKQNLDRLTAELLHEIPVVEERKDLVNFLLFSNPVMSRALLESIVGSYGWKDSICCKKMSVVCAKVIQLTLEKQIVSELLCSNLLTECLKVLNDSYFYESQQEIIGLITFIYVKYRPVTELPKTVFLNIPNTNTDVLQKFDQQIMNDKSEKRQKHLMRNHLKEITGKNVGSWFKNKVNILKIPEKLFINRFDQKAQDNQIPEDGFFSLFSSKD